MHESKADKTVFVVVFVDVFLYHKSNASARWKSMRVKVKQNDKN